MLKHYQKEAYGTLYFEPAILWVDSIDGTQAQIDAFDTKSDLNDLRQEKMIQSPCPEKIAQAKIYFDQLSQTDPERAQVFSLIMNAVFCAHSEWAHGGSSSSSIGILWINPKSVWEPLDGAELLVHEMTHQLLFLDERRYKHYRDYSQITKKENFARSAILKKQRPLDKVLHSLVVTTEILLYRNKWNLHNRLHKLHGSSESLLKSAFDCIESIQSLETFEDLFLDRGRVILKQAELKLQYLSLELKKMESDHAA